MNCGEVDESAIGSTITVAGWVHRRRDHGNLIFIDLRDRSGLLQVVFNPENSEGSHEIAGTLRSEWVVQIKGRIISRLPGAKILNCRPASLNWRLLNLWFLIRR